MTLIRRTLTYLWTSPTTLPGLVLIALCTPAGSRVRLVDGVLELTGGPVAWGLRRLVPLEGGAAAMTLGHVVIALDDTTAARTRRHERVHVRQAEVWGPFFYPAYLGASLIQYLRGKDPYIDNPFEKAAYARG